jgi:NACHT domain
MCDDLLEGSGEWLLERNDFRQWEFSTSSTVLWLHGILGSGKSKLVACIIGHLQKSPEFLPGNFAFFYCVRGDSDKERSNPEEVIRSLLRQLAFHDDPFNSYNPFNASNSLKDPVAKLYKEKAAHSQKTRHEVEKFTKKECIDILTDLLKGGSTTIIIDAFDELDRSTRGLLFQVFDTINGELRKSKDGGIVRLLVSSRNDQDIVRKLANYHNIEIGVEDNKKDIERFVYVEVAKAISSGMLLSGNVSQDLQSEIESVLIKKSRGM